MTLSTSIAIALGLILTLPAAALAQPVDLATVKSLYASASYEEALSRLAVTEARGGDVDQLEQYRALCLLALGRSGEAQRSLEQIVMRSPLFKMNEAEVSPRLVTIFKDVRRRMLPRAARDLYAKGKANLEQKKYAIAASQLKELRAILADEDAADEAGDLADLKLLGEGFLKLAEMELAEADKATAAAAAAAKAAAPPPAPTPPGPPPIYVEGDADVVPPVEIDRRMPNWDPPTAFAQRTEFRGLLEVIIDERGNVERAALIKPVFALYNSVLLDAAKNWRFRPATRMGEPVKFRKRFEVILKPKS